MAEQFESSGYDAIPDFGALYDAVPVYGTRQDVQFYVAEAAQAPGGVLELGCGTGRILLPIARTGATVDGLDGSQHMLARCRAKLAEESAELRSRVTLHKGDARAFDLGKTFSLVIAPFRIFQHLITIDEQLSCLEGVTRHLQPGGRFIFDVFNPHFHRMTEDRSVEQEDTPAHVIDDGRVLRRTYRVPRMRWTDQVSETELVYYIAPDKNARPERFVHRFEMRWFVPSELNHLLARGGFRVQAIHGDFNRSALTDSSPEQVVVAERL